MKYALACGFVLACAALAFAYAAPYGWRTAGMLSSDDLAFARELARQKPLMALAGTEPGKLRAAVGALEETNERLAARQADEHAAALVRAALYPTTTLMALADLEEKRLTFIASGSADDLRAYDAALDGAIAAYRADLARFRAAYLQAVPENVPDYAAGTSRVTRSSAIEAMDALERGVEATERLARERRACIAGDHSLCPPVPSDPPAAPVISEDERALAMRVRAALIEGARIGEPVVEMAKGACTIDLPGGGLYAPYDTGDAILPTYLGELPLVKTDEHARMPFYRYFANRGLAYIPSYPLTHYGCPEFAGEFSRFMGALRGVEPDTPEARNNSVAFDEVVRFVVYMEGAIAAADEHGAPGAFDAATLFYVRSAFPALFLSHNPSVVGAHERLFPALTAKPENYPFVFFSALPASERHSVVEGIRAFDDAHRPSL